MEVQYRTDLEAIQPAMLAGFFEGWPDPPSPETHREILEGSRHRVLALDRDSREVVGYITAVSDGVLSAFIPLLEVRPEYRGRGIGSELVRRMLEELSYCYIVDLVCDEELREFYEPLGFRPGRAMLRRNYSRQSGKGERPHEG